MVDQDQLVLPGVRWFCVCRLGSLSFGYSIEFSCLWMGMGE
jgi:hypothetical protein